MKVETFRAGVHAFCYPELEFAWLSVDTEYAENARPDIPFHKMYDAQDDIFHVAATSVCVDNGVYKSGDGCETNLLVSCFVVQHKLKLFVRKDGGHIRCVFSEDEREEIRIRPSIYETFRRQRTL